jgi:hypothetical protein
LALSFANVQVVSLLSYYFGLTAIPDALVVDQLLGVPTYKLQEFAYVRAPVARNPLLAWPGACVASSPLCS